MKQSIHEMSNIVLKHSILIFGIIFLAFSCGCTKKATLSTAQGNVEISQKGDQVTIQDKENKVTISQKISQQDLGAPIYPGAKLGENSSMMK